jgi:hypothetical protein
MTVAADRWTCPSCARTVVIHGSAADVRCCIAAAQRRHAKGHAAGQEVLRRLGLPDPINTRKQA